MVLSVILFCLSDECFTVLMNCLLNAVAMSLCVTLFLLLKLIVLFGCNGVFLFESVLIVLQRVCVLCL